MGFECLNQTNFGSCGKCAACKSLKAWIKRRQAELEMIDAPRMWFCTLTFRQNPAHWNDKFRARCLQLWLKEIRNEGIELRYMAVQEQGSRTGRYHWHVLLFPSWNVPRSQLPLWRWGYSDIRLGGSGTVGYVAKYLRKSSGRCITSQRWGMNGMHRIAENPEVRKLLQMIPGSRIRAHNGKSVPRNISEQHRAIFERHNGAPAQARTDFTANALADYPGHGELPWTPERESPDELGEDKRGDERSVTREAPESGALAALGKSVTRKGGPARG